MVSTGGGSRRSVLSLAGILLLFSCGGKPPTPAPARPGLPEVTPRVCDMGTVLHGTSCRCAFTLVNPGPGPLKVKGVRIGCSCAHPALRVYRESPPGRLVHEGVARPEAFAVTLQPGEKALLQVRYETLERPAYDADLEQPVTFFLDHPKVKRIDCLMKVRIRRRLDFTPTRPNFGDIAESGKGLLTLDLKPLPGKPPIHVKGFTGTGKVLQARVLEERPSFTRILFTARPGRRPGYFLLPLIIRTDVDGGYDLPLFLGGRVVPDLSLTPPSPLSLGRVVPGRTSSTTALLEWNKEGKTLHPKIKKVEGPRGTSAFLRPSLPGKAWHLVIRLDPPAGTKLPPRVRGEVRIETDSPEYPVFTVVFQGFSREGAR